MPAGKQDPTNRKQGQTGARSRAAGQGGQEGRRDSPSRVCLAPRAAISLVRLLYQPLVSATPRRAPAAAPREFYAGTRECGVHFGPWNGRTGGAEDKRKQLPSKKTYLKRRRRNNMHEHTGTHTHTHQHVRTRTQAKKIALCCSPRKHVRDVSGIGGWTVRYSVVRNKANRRKIHPLSAPAAIS